MCGKACQPSFGAHYDTSLVEYTAAVLMRFQAFFYRQVMINIFELQDRIEPNI
jgi:hypothetical protein